MVTRFGGMSVDASPHRLVGPWSGGYALDVHTTSSTMVGHNAFGHPVSDTVRSPLGELLSRLKNRGDEAVLPGLHGRLSGNVKCA